MHCKLVQATIAKGIDPGIFPHVGAITTVLAKLEGVGMRRTAVLENKAKLVLGSIKATHAGVVFGPHHKILKLEVVVPARSGQLGQVSPIHKTEHDGAVLASPLRTAQIR